MTFKRIPEWFPGHENHLGIEVDIYGKDVLTAEEALELAHLIHERATSALDIAGDNE